MRMLTLPFAVLMILEMEKLFSDFSIPTFSSWTNNEHSSERDLNPKKHHRRDFLPMKTQFILR